MDFAQKTSWVELFHKTSSRYMDLHVHKIYICVICDLSGGMIQGGIQSSGRQTDSPVDSRM